MKTTVPEFIVRARGTVVALTLLSFLGSGAAVADSSTWNATPVDSSWSTDGNWLNGVPGNTSSGTTPSADTATFSDTSTTTVDLDAGRTIGSITFDNLAENYTINGSGSGPLYLSSTGTVQTASNATETLNTPVVISGANATYTFTNTSGGGTLNVTGPISGDTAGTTALTLDGSNANDNTLGGGISDGGATHFAVTKNGFGNWVLGGSKQLQRRDYGQRRHAAIQRRRVDELQLGPHDRQRRHRRAAVGHLGHVHSPPASSCPAPAARSTSTSTPSRRQVRRR
ncbi:MAG: hypothetical protein WDO13_21500 [Verrucomicrobiota bacterium]